MQCFPMLIAFCIVATNGAFLLPDEHVSSRLDPPTVVLPTQTPQADEQRILDVLRGPQFQVVDARLFRGYSMKRYNGTTESLNEFLKSLVACPGVVLHVKFEKSPHRGHYMEGVNWVVHHEPLKMKFVIRINPDADRFSLSELVLPEMHTRE